jgi:hypothetical protein
VGIEVLAEQKLSTSAVEAFLAKLGIAGRISVVVQEGIWEVTNSATTRSPTVKPLTFGPMAAWNT